MSENEQEHPLQPEEPDHNKRQDESGGELPPYDTPAPADQPADTSPAQDSPEAEIPASDSPLLADEPPLAEDDTKPNPAADPDEPANDAADTKPKPPEGLREAIAAQHAAAAERALESDAPYEQIAADEPPIDPLEDTAQNEPLPPLRTPARPLLLAVVMASTACICVAMIGLAGFAGYRDGLATNDARITQTLATGIAEQYATGVADMAEENYELAIARFGWIVQTIQPAPEYMRDSAERLAMASTMNAYTATPTITPTITPSPTLTPSIAPTTALSATPSGPDPAELYNEATTAYSRSDYESTIEWAETLRAVAPNYRASEVQAMYMDALTILGKNYIRGLNSDGEDKLARGVRLLYLADEIGTVEPPSLMYEADVAERYLNARNYINGGNYAAAIPVLEGLCAESDSTCNWGYHGVSVRDLLDRARAGGPAGS